jgi:hypothetical protein
MRVVAMRARADGDGAWSARGVVVDASTTTRARSRRV